MPISVQTSFNQREEEGARGKDQSGRKCIPVGFSSSIQYRNGHRKWVLLTPVPYNTTAGVVDMRVVGCQRFLV